MVPKIKLFLNEIAQDHSRFSAHISGTGCFPTPKRARILWLGVEEDIQPLIDLGNTIRNKMTEIGFPPDEKKFSPHITIGRIQYPIKRSPDISEYLSAEFDPIVWKPKYFHLMRSELFPNGPVYTILGTHILQN
jgi:2'-5' RNA ligase